MDAQVCNHLNASTIIGLGLGGVGREGFREITFTKQRTFFVISSVANFFSIHPNRRTFLIVKVVVDARVGVVKIIR